VRGDGVVRFTVVLALMLLALAIPRTSIAQEEGQRPRRPDPLAAYVLTFGPGDHPFFKFGHNAIWIHDGRKRGRERDKVYNYGTFSFGDPALIPKFFLGRFQYWLSASTLPTTLAVYKRENRTVDAQELDLDYEQKVELARLLEENLKPENRYYKYDYYRDNCSTRVRDMIDRVVEGRLKAASGAPGRMTYRQHTMRLTADLATEMVILDLIMGDLIDKPTTLWDEAFLPMELQQSMRNTTLIDAEGVERPLVKGERNLVSADRAPARETPPLVWPWGLCVGAVLGGGLFALGRAAPHKRAARTALGLILAFVGLVWGFFGWFFLAAWAFTDHAVGYGNENVLLCVPWAIVLVGSGVRVARGRPSSMLLAEKLLLAALASAVLAVVLKALPWFDQDNRLFLAFFVPFWAGAFFGMRALASHARAGDRPAASEAAKASGNGDGDAADDSEDAIDDDEPEERDEPEESAADEAAQKAPTSVSD
jgi:hypothetical protein